MKKHLKFITILTVFLLGLGTIIGIDTVGANSFSNDDVVTVSKHLSSPENYIEYLEGYDKDEALRLGIENEHSTESINGAKTAMVEFKKLSRHDQLLFLEYMKDPESLFNVEDSNLQIVEEVEVVDNYQSPGLFASRSVTHKGSIKVLGITWAKYSIEGKYEYNSSKVTKKLMNNAWVSWNINPTVTNSKVRDVGYVSGGVYYGEGKWSYKLGVIGTGVVATVGTVDIRVNGKRTGKSGGSFWTTPGG